MPKWSHIYYSCPLRISFACLVCAFLIQAQACGSDSVSPSSSSTTATGRPSSLPPSSPQQPATSRPGASPTPSASATSQPQSGALRLDASSVTASPNSGHPGWTNFVAKLVVTNTSNRVLDDAALPTKVKIRTSENKNYEATFGCEDERNNGPYPGALKSCTSTYLPRFTFCSYDQVQIMVVRAEFPESLVAKSIAVDGFDEVDVSPSRPATPKCGPSEPLTYTPLPIEVTAKWLGNIFPINLTRVVHPDRDVCVNVATCRPGSDVIALSGVLTNTDRFNDVRVGCGGLGANVDLLVGIDANGSVRSAIVDCGIESAPIGPLKSYPLFFGVLASPVDGRKAAEITAIAIRVSGELMFIHP